MKHLNTLNTWSKVMGVGAIALISLAGCTGQDQTGDGQTADSVPAAKMDQAGENMENAAGNVGDAVGNAAAQTGDAVANGAAAVGDSVAAGADKAANAVSNADDVAMTPKVKTALGANASLNGSEIDVDTANGVVHLKGTVKNAAQKTAAETIAKREAPNYKVSNELTVK